MGSSLTSRPQQRTVSLLRPLYQFPAIVKLILKRQRHYLGLTFLALVDIILAVGLITNAAFFSQAVDRVVLLQELKQFSATTGRPPLSTSIYIFPSRRKPLQLEAAEALSPHISQTLSTEIGLPIRHQGFQVTGGSLMLQPSPDSELFAQGKKYLGNIETAYIANVSDQMEIVEGVPLDESGVSKDVLDIWMYESTAQSMGIHIGEKLAVGATLSSTQVPVRVAGIWRAKDAEADFWFNNPDSELRDTFLVRRSDYLQRIQPITDSGTGEAAWYVILDENSIIPKESEQYLKGFNRSLEIIDKFLPGSKMNTPPLDPLAKFIKRSSTLTVLLLGYNLPAFAILLYFLALTSAIMVQWQRRETVMLVSRGMSLVEILNLTLIEQSILFMIGYPLGILFGMFIAWAMGFTSSFLTFTSRSSLPVSMEGFNLPLTILALACALIFRLWPAVHAARSSLVSEERERARPMRKPIWYRLYLDLFLLIPTWYAYDQMSKRGSLAGLITDKPEDLYRDPLLIVIPALFILTSALITMRFFAILMRLIDLVSGRIPWLTLHLALRQLGRQSLDYVQPLLLVLIALAMGVYTLSMAASLDQWTVDRMYYRAGADLVFTPTSGGSSVSSSSAEGAASSGDASFDGSWIPLPGDFQAIPGVESATRVADLSMQLSTGVEGSKEVRGRFLAIDRAEFASAAWFRPDFANESLGAMMNRLAIAQESVLVSEKFLTDRGLKVGDYVSMLVVVPSLVSVYSDYMIAGTYNYFPTVYEDSITVIGNIDYISTLTGLTIPHDIWLKLSPGADSETVLKAIGSTLHVYPATASGALRDANALVAAEQGRMERVGIFGTLSIGFIAAALMAILGLLVYSYASLQERAYRLAVLNAVGLSRNQIMSQVVMEYAFLALFGVVAGALIGLATSELFVPFFRYTGEKGIALPPLIPIIAGDQLRNLSLIFGLTIVTIEVGTMASILHNRLVQILKRVWM
jgi:putative ABC transport system permease protein